MLVTNLLATNGIGNYGVDDQENTTGVISTIAPQRAPLPALFGLILSLSLALGLTTTLVSCTGGNGKKQSHKDFNQTIDGPVSKLISTRPEKSGPLKIIIRLPAEPLGNVNKEQRADQLTLILAQQNELREQLESLSSQIQIIYTYKFVLNGLYVVIPEDLANQVDPLLPQGSLVESATVIRRPEVSVKEILHQNEKPFSALQTQTTPGPIQIDSLSTNGTFKERNSVKFIGAEELQSRGLRGQGLRLGVIDTGIDYTHSMLGGSGSTEDYKKIDPRQKNAAFPNAKVVGGFDFVGTEYNAASPNPLLRIPRPDENPLDESGHGTHVAGTIAGLGDGINSYTGVAPESSLYALKVFGKEGSTDDAIVIAALDYAADPDGNIDTTDPLDVVNLSLGSPYGSPHLLYREAITNLNRIGTVIVASAGNSGNVPFITGAPAINEEALSVAASIDDMDQNWHFGAATFQLSGENEILAEMAEASFTKPLKSIETLNGNLVYIGKGASLSEEQKNSLKGQIALIDRGEITFADKINTALRGGAIAAIVVNNSPGSPFTMGGGTETLDIPAIMIGLEAGQKIRDQVQRGLPVMANLKSDKSIAKPELIDTLTDFSSRGPRSEDAYIKPEISAPGANIISAKVGAGNEVVAMSGTSMAAPHMTGVMALLKQGHRTLQPQELKSLAMLTAKPLHDTTGNPYPIAQQGAGRIQSVIANDGALTMVPAAVSLGRNEIENAKTIVRAITLKNISDKDLQLSVTTQLNSNLQLISPRTFSLKPMETQTAELQIKLRAPANETFANELDGFLQFKDQEGKVYSLPVLTLALKVSNIKSSPLKIHATSINDSVDSLAELTLQNTSPHKGRGYLFQLLGQDGRKADQGLQKRGLSTACDLESVGYRTIELLDEGTQKLILQMALKLYNPLTTWNTCEFSVQIDANGDGIADQELAGASRENTEGLGKGMASILLNAEKARALRKAYETKVAISDENPSSPSAEKPVLDFSSAVEHSMNLIGINQSTLMIVQVPINNLKAIPGQNLRVKVGSLNLEGDTVENDDFLGQGWLEVPLQPIAQTIKKIPEVIEVRGNGSTNLSLTKAEGTAPLIFYYPFNHGTMSSAADQQSQLLSTEFTQE